MAPVVTDHPGPDPVPLASLIPLRHHLPHSFAVLRRAQFTHFAQGTTPHAHFLFASDPSGPFRDGAGDDDDPAQGPKHFAAAYLDLSRHPETEMYLYSTLQDVPDPGAALPAAEVAHALSLVAALFGRVRHVAAQQQQHPHPRAGRAGVGVMVGNLHEATYRLLLDAGRCGLRSSYWNPHDVWLFRVGDLPGGGGGGEVAEALPADDGLRWSVIRREDVPLIASRTKIPKEADTLMSEPSVAVRDARGGLVAWGFMGVAGTLSTLHVEVSRRKKTDRWDVQIGWFTTTYTGLTLD